MCTKRMTSYDINNSTRTQHIRKPRENMFNFSIYFYAITIITTEFLHMSAATLLDQLNYIATHNQYTTQIFQLPFSMDNIMTASLDLALQNCQNDFKWQRWNCPSSDFFMRRTSQPTHIDREDAYVTAITTAAIINTITKSCSSDTISECRCPENEQCQDDPVKAIEIYENHVQQNFAKDFTGAVRKHNYKVITNLMSNALQQQCHCSKYSTNGAKCIEEVCQNVMKPFADIAKEIFQLYDESIQVTSAANTRIIWANIPLDTMLYAHDSPNFCEPDAIPLWNGMRGRQCSIAYGDEVPNDEQDSCNQLCRACGYRIRSHTIVTEQHCNCKFVWGYQWQCEKCVSIEQQYFCY